MLEIDPKQASVDIDATTLTEWSLIPRETGFIVKLNFEGGLGHALDKNDQQQFLDPVEHIAVSRALPPEENLETTMREQLSSWQTIGTPLRILDFEDGLIILEDKNNYIRLPPLQ